MFMPRWASRLRLLVKKIRVQRLQSISLADMEAEGAKMHTEDGTRGAFRGLWNEINAKRGFPWEDDPWVWVVDFELKNPDPVGDMLEELAAAEEARRDGTAT
jgi:hypothetical protein